MAVKAQLRFAAATDPGKRRKNNEDRYYVDPERGIYVVIDGVGGHAAGETAASVAADVIRERMERETGSPEQRIREAITLANNEILRLSRIRPEWTGMACVLTLALVEDDIVTIGHVGDSRLYLLRPGEIKKITHDHSPVGEREDRGELSEAEAMRHSRRNEIFRDVGSSERNPDDPGFIEMETFPMPPDGVLLLCSDGLTDLITSAELRAGIERYAPDFDAATRALIDAANEAGGKDNITIVIVAGSGYGEDPVRSRTRTTKRTIIVPRTAFYLLGGLLLGLLMGVAIPIVWNRVEPTTGPRTFVVGTGGISAALAQAHSGDTVVVPQGKYRERLELREGVSVRAQLPGTVTLTSPDGGPAVVARHIVAGSLDDLWIQGDADAPLSVGIELSDSSVSVSHVKVSGAGTGIEVRGTSSPVISASQITNNAGPGILVQAPAAPRIDGNLIAANGNAKPGIAKPGVEVLDGAHPVLKNNGIVDNGAEPIWIHGAAFRNDDYVENYFGGLSTDEAIRLVSDKPPVTTGRSSAIAPSVSAGKHAAKSPHPVNAPAAVTPDTSSTGDHH
jgi:serine/threonine protein phosphatase PrpC